MAIVKQASLADPCQVKETSVRILSAIEEQSERQRTMIQPPPTPSSPKKPPLSRPNILVLQSVTIISSSVQAGEQDQLKPGFETAPVNMSAKIL
jgi:hypothetical protein